MRIRLLIARVNWPQLAIDLFLGASLLGAIYALISIWFLF